MVKRFGKLFTVIAACALCLACLAGCGGGVSDAEAAANNRAYMAQANTAMMQLNADLVPFSEAAAAGDVVTMEQAATTAMRDMRAFEEITAPEGMTAIHAEYVAGCRDLRAALQQYVQLYRESPNLDDAAFNERIATIQRQYDDGIAHIQQGDKLVTELTGALPEGESKAESSSASQQSQSDSAAASSNEAAPAAAAAPANAQTQPEPAAEEATADEAEQADETVTDEALDEEYEGEAEYDEEEEM